MELIKLGSASKTVENSAVLTRLLKAARQNLPESTTAMMAGITIQRLRELIRKGEKETILDADGNMVLTTTLAEWVLAYKQLRGEAASSLYLMAAEIALETKNAGTLMQMMKMSDPQVDKGLEASDSELVLTIVETDRWREVNATAGRTFTPEEAMKGEKVGTDSGN